MKKFIPLQRGTRESQFLIGKVDLDASDTLTPWTFGLPVGPGSPGYVLQTDGTGVTSWAAVGAASDSTVPYFIPTGETFVVNLFRQALFSTSIDVEGTLEVNGLLIEV